MIGNLFICSVKYFKCFIRVCIINKYIVVKVSKRCYVIVYLRGYYYLVGLLLYKECFEC